MQPACNWNCHGCLAPRHCPLLQVITPFNVYFNAHLIFKKGEIWRLFTNFFFFGNLGEGHRPCGVRLLALNALCAAQIRPYNSLHISQHASPPQGLCTTPFLDPLFNLCVYRVMPCSCRAGLDFVFHMFFLVKYCKSLEEGEQAGGGV